VVLCAVATPIHEAVKAKIAKIFLKFMITLLKVNGQFNTQEKKIKHDARE
jgi:hypothetical protein